MQRRNTFVSSGNSDQQSSTLRRRSTALNPVNQSHELERVTEFSHDEDEFSQDLSDFGMTAAMENKEASKLESLIKSE